jgi:hypothetical protein
VFVTPFTHPLVSAKGRVALDKIRIRCSSSSSSSGIDSIMYFRVVGGSGGAAAGGKSDSKGRALGTLTLLKVTCDL